MKNSVLYSLVGLMVISLAGIIVLQSLWVSKAISDQEEEFENRVNAALNEVNANIDEEEAFFFLKDELAGLRDSLEVLTEFEQKMEESLVISDGDRIEISINDGSTDVTYEQVLGDSDLPLDAIHEAMKTVQVEVKDHISFGDSMIVVTEGKLNKLDNISTVVRRYVTEHSFSGDIEDRLPQPTLDSLLKKGLEKQGIELDPEYAVFQSPSKKPLTDYTTKGFDVSQKELSFTKELFPNDRTGQDFELFLQLDGTNGFVWSGIKSIVILCVVFSLLILVCFGYSLHFIFKQKRLSQVKNDFINNMTHELKTPLASISLAAASIRHPNVIGDPVEIKRFTDIIQSEEKRMNEHVERVLDMAALDYQELKMNRESVELNALVHESIDHIQLAVDAAEGKVNFVSNVESAVVNADKFHLLSALINILDNSIKYQDGGLEIAVSLTEESGNYQLTFSDNGIGMKKSAVKQAFNKFYREETGNIHTRKGFGLGLSYVKSIVELHGGSIDLSSEQHKGTTVRIKLPKL